MEKNNLVDYNWENIEHYTQEEVSYFLYLEGKSIDAISKIRNIPVNEVKNHIIEGKIKYRFLVKARDSKELIEYISKAGKDDKKAFLKILDAKTKSDLIKYIVENYTELYSKEKETSIWILGEVKAIDGIGILTKAAVHKFVNVRRMAVSALGKLENLEGEGVLLRALEDDNPQVVGYAIKALGRLKSTRAKDKIILLYKNTNNNGIKRAAEEYLGMIERE